jgi:hypothetical protein
VGAVAAALLAHRAVGAVGEKLAVTAICAVAGASLAVLGAVDALGALAAFVALRLATNMLAPILSTAINRESPDDIRATVASIGVMATGVAGMLVKPVMGYTAGEWSLVTAFALDAVLFAVLATGALLAWARTGAAPQDSPEAAVAAA